MTNFIIYNTIPKSEQDLDFKTRNRGYISIYIEREGNNLFSEWWLSRGGYVKGIQSLLLCRGLRREESLTDDGKRLNLSR